MNLKYFTAAELADSITGVTLLAPGFGAKLDELREAYGKPMIINSACRSLAHNKDVGGSTASFHLYEGTGRNFVGTCAVDVAVASAEERWAFIKCAMLLGWSVGFERGCVHIDRRSDYIGGSPIAFVYPGQVA